MGLAALSGDGRILAFPGRTEGHVNIVELGSGAKGGQPNVTILPAHQGRLAAIAVGRKGEVVVTASEKGTIIRVWEVGSGALVRELRRGVDKAVIWSLSVSPSGGRLAVVSDKNTLHIYALPVAGGGGSGPGVRPGSAGGGGDGGEGIKGDNKRWSMLGKLPLLPNYFRSEWSAAQAEFQGAGKACVGWTGEDTVVVVSCGDRMGGEPRWEKFVIVETVVERGQGGGRGGGAGMGGREVQIECLREGWRRYMDND